MHPISSHRLCHVDGAQFVCRKAGWLVVALVLAMTLGACGKKPGQVDPPDGIGKKDFPRTYPDPALDPK